MSTLTISDDAGPITVISTFTVEPVRQAELVTKLANQASALLGKQAGFIGCAIHASQDGCTVINYGLWRDEDAVKGMFDVPAVREHAAAVRRIATVQPIHCTVRHVIRGPSLLS
jgi:heme-degrading monooxygenase HmoA